MDSHLDLPVIGADEATFRRGDLRPFAMLLPDADAVMTAHIVVRSLDTDRPATLSPVLLTQLLRDEIGFQGVCFTDCMQMEAIAADIGPAEGAVQALVAGADCILISSNVQLALQSIDAVVKAVDSGRLSLQRLRQAYQRIQELQARVHAPLALSAAPPHPGIGREIARRGVTVLRGHAKALASQSLIVSFEGTTADGAEGVQSEHPSPADGRGIPQFRVPLEPRTGDLERLLRDVRAQAARPIVLMRRAHLYESQAAAVRAILAQQGDAIIVSTREPFDAFLFEEARTVLCTYGDDRPSMQGLGDVLFDDAGAKGRFPLERNVDCA